jgi:signal transduction histidine kinase
MVQAELQAMGRDFAPVKMEGRIPDEIVCRVARDRMVLALRNLIKNAYDAFMINVTTFNPGTIWMEAAEVENGILITIRDDGMGLNEQELEDVRQFVPGKSSKDNLGTGFGLPIARKTIRDHGGDLRIESKEDEGTEVSVWLPADTKHNP